MSKQSRLEERNRKQAALEKLMAGQTRGTPNMNGDMLDSTRVETERLKREIAELDRMIASYT